MRIFAFVMLSLLSITGLGSRVQGAIPVSRWHNVEQPSAFGAFDYLEQSYDEYIKTVRGPILSEDHVFTTYAQTLVSQLDNIIRIHFQQQMAGVPIPKIAIRKTPEIGAFTAGYRRVCYQVPITISEGIEDIPSNRIQAIEPSPGHLSPTLVNSCALVNVPKERFGDFAAWYSQRFAPCGLKVKKSGQSNTEPHLVMTGPCREQDFFPKKSSVSAIVTKVAPNRILLFSGLFQILKSENELLAVIAHELAHFYRAHAAGVRLYDYCYEISSKNHGHRPKPDPKLNDLCQKLRPRIDFSIEEATQRRLGVYTQEQEADEMALEILALSGIPTTAAVEAWFSLSQEVGLSSNAEPAIPMNECLKLRSNGWVDSKGRDVFVPIGDYRDEHHSWCYRIHNIDKEIFFHQYSILPRVIPETNWDKVQETARTL